MSRNYNTLKHATALLVLLFLAMTTSCVSRKNNLICYPEINDEHFTKFDSAYVSDKWHFDKTSFDLVRQKAGMPLSDTLIILTSYPNNKYPEILAKSGDSFIAIGYERDGCCYFPTRVKHYSGQPENYENLYDSARVATVFSWDIAELNRRLHKIDDGYPYIIDVYSVMTRVVTRNGRIQSWEEYSFNDPFIPEPADEE